MKNFYLFFLITLILSACKEKSPQETLSIAEGYLEINGSDVYYKMMGKGSPIVIIHGGPVLDHSYMLPWFESLAMDHQLVFYDQRACGRSSVEVDTNTMSIKGFTDDIELLRQGLHLGKVHVLGHSWGGLIAMHYAIKYPDYIETLILSNSIPPSVEEWQEEQKIMAQLVTEDDKKKRVEIMSSPDMTSNPGKVINQLLMLSFKTQFYKQENLDSLTLFIPNDYLDRSKVFQQLGPDLVSFNLYEDLKNLKNRILIIYGEDEPAASVSGKNMAVNIPKAELTIISRSGHFPFIEQPAIYFSSINKFLNK